MARPPSDPKSACSVSPFCAKTTRVNDPASTICPGSSACPCGPILLASQATPSAGWPSTPAARPVSSISALRYMMPPTQRRSTSIGPSAHGNAGGSTIVGNRIDDLALILNPRIDDLDRRNDVFGRTQHIAQPHAWTLQLLAHDERKLDFDARLAVVGVFELRAIGDQL